MTSFIDLPDELRVEIVGYLDYVSILIFSHCCKSFRSTVSTSSTLQYKVTLGLNFMRDGGSQMTHSELLTLLQARCASWQRLHWNNLTVVKVPGSCEAYELVAGVFVKSNRTSLTVVSLPSSRIKTHMLVQHELDIVIRDFAIDPTQDVIAVLEDNHVAIPWNQTRIVRIHFRSVATGVPHSDAALPFVTFQVIADPFVNNGIHSVEMQMHDSMISIFMCRGRALHAPRAVVWNWKSGALIYDSTADNPIGFPDTVHSFSLISAGSFFCTSRDGSGRIHIYMFPDSPTRRATYIGTLSLPDIQPSREILSLSVHSGPHHARAPTGTPFTTSFDGMVNCFSVLYTPKTMEGEFSRFNIFIRNSTFLKYVEEYRQSGQLISRLWDAWGPTECRFLPNHLPRSWLRYIHGHRFICGSTHTDGIAVLDFNPPAAPSFSSNSFELRENFDRKSPTVIGRADLFCADVVSSLPYHVTSRLMTQSYFAYMIDEERIIGLKPLREIEMELHVYTF